MCVLRLITKHESIFLRSILTIIDHYRVIITARDQSVAVWRKIYSIYAVCVFPEYFCYSIITNNIVSELHFKGFLQYIVSQFSQEFFIPIRRACLSLISHTPNYSIVILKKSFSIDSIIFASFPLASEDEVLYCVKSR